MVRGLLFCLVASASAYVSADDATSNGIRPANGTQAMAAACHPAAVEAGLAIMKAGGNAVDAAIAMNAVLAVVEPMSCGPGGDLFAIVYEAKTGRMHGLNASGRSPFAANRKVFADRKHEWIPTLGPLSWSTPGCVDGWEQLRKKLGTKSFVEIFAPAVQAAEKGFIVAPTIARGWKSSRGLLSRDPASAATFLTPQGEAPAVNSTFTNPKLAAFFRRIAEKGAEDFYHGRIAEDLTALSARHGGLWSKRDFTEHQSTWVDPLSIEYRGRRVWQLPPNGQGLAVLQMLNILEGYDLKKLGHNSPEFAHLFIEAKKLAYEDRAVFYADPDFEKNNPATVLASKPYAAKRRALIRPGAAALDVPAGDPKLGASETTYLCAVDKDRNAVSLIQSNYFGWGSGITVDEWGFTIQNRGTLFSLKETHANRLEPHKRPFHTIIPAMVTENQRPVFCFGVMGGDMQPQGQVQLLVNLFDHGMDPQAAGSALRIRHDGSSTPTGRQMEGGGEVVLETDLPASLEHSLRTWGHTVKRDRPSGFGGYQGIYIDWRNGRLLGGSETRKDGYAKGF